MKRLSLLILFLAAVGCSSAPPPVPAPPPLLREFRGVWVATVKNIDWPSRPGLTKEEQQAELVALLDRAKELNFNAVFFQVRPAADAMYRSDLEPWSEFLSGRMGADPGWDPLAFAIKGAHERGLELHAWFNPYRARHTEPPFPPSAGHISVLAPHLVRQYGAYQWMDPGEDDVRRRTISVVLDVLRRYDVDGVHFDDYFYPYPESAADGTPIPFPDETSYERYLAAGGTLGRDDWRRDNVDRLIRELGAEVRRVKPHARFGVSPFGIWRPGYPTGTEGFDAWSGIYADSKRWLEEGWVDYLAPQLYWPIADPVRSFPTLLQWWLDQNPKRRHVWPGIAPSRVANGSRNAFYPEEILNQVLAARELGAAGTIHFSMKPYLQDRAGLGTRLADSLYAEPALPPATPWLDSAAPAPPMLTWNEISRSIGISPGESEAPQFWVVQAFVGGRWVTDVVSGELRELPLGTHPAAIAAFAVDRVGNASRTVTLMVR
jgi:uncharacterized lipoprotein YddW (UPF0748 family)